MPPVTITDVPSNVTFPVPETKLSLFVQFLATLISLFPAFRVPSVIVRDPFTSRLEFKVIVPEVLSARL